MQTEVLETKSEHRRNCLGGDALPTVCGIDDITNRYPFIADAAIVIVDQAETMIGCFIGDRPKPIVRRRTVDEAPHCALGLDTLGVERRIPKTHRLDIGETGVHRVHIVVPELAQAQPRSHQDRMWYRLLRHFASTGSWIHVVSLEKPRALRGALSPRFLFMLR
jgi:hypothetical protein